MTRARGDRRGFSLVEVLVASAVLAAGAWALLALIQSNYRETVLELRREAARTAAGNMLGKLSSTRFADIEKEFGPGAKHALDPLGSRLLNKVPVADIVQGMETRVKLMRSPSDPGSGHLEVRLVYREEEDRERTFVLGRTMTDPARAGRLGDAVRGEQQPENLVERASIGLGSRSYGLTRTGAAPAAGVPYSPAQEEALQSLLAALPADSFARVAMRIAKLDARDGHFDLDWTRLVATAARSGWDPVLRELASTKVPDGEYAVHWDVVPLRDPSGARIKRKTGNATVYMLTKLDGTDYFLIRMEPGEAAPVTLNDEPAREMVTTAVAAAGREGIKRREVQEVTALFTASRVHLVHQPIDALGRAGRYEPRMLVWTPSESGSSDLLDQARAERALAKAVKMVGLDPKEAGW